MAPIAAAARDDGEGWRWALGAWGAVALLPLVVWIVLARRTGHDFPAVGAASGDGGSLLRSPTALALTLLFGVQSMNAYVQFAWVPQILRDAGLSVVVHAGPGNFKSQFKRADASGARVAVILGADEVAAQAASVKFLRAEEQGENAQQRVPLAQLADVLNIKG